jgi:serine/threonine protein kinase
VLDPGTRLGRYTILDLVAVGGMGEVYRAEDARLHRDVAIKVLPSHLEQDRVSMDRFFREARAVAALSHPNILAIFDFGSENGVHYAVTELLEGENLRARLSRERLSSREALQMMLEIADGVAAAHARGIVHRDLKPENIFITREGRVKVLDFGLARNAGVTRGGPIGMTEMLPTEPGIVIGTIGYLAPEQLEARSPTPATDVFALGCMLFEMLSGALPFDHASQAHTMVAVMRDPAPRLKLTGEPQARDLDALVQRCLEKKPEQRVPDAGTLASELRGLLAGERLSRALRPPVLYRTSRSRLIAITAVAIITIASLAGAIYFLRDTQLDNGYDLRASDVRADRETTRLVGLALRADAEGNRPKAMELLEEAWRRPTATPFPAAFLSSFNDAAGNLQRSTYWRAEAEKRLRGASAYESLLVRYLYVPSSNSQQELALAKSALDLRPKAWRLRLAAAHIYLSHRDREAARRELQQIDVHMPDDRRLMFVLADRASLGDINGAERDLRGSGLVKFPPLLHYTEARMAWSRGDMKRATELFDRAADDAANEGLSAVEVEARELAGLGLLRRGQWAEGQRRFAMSGARARQLGLTYRAFTSAALAAYAAHRAGDAEERDRKLLDAAALTPNEAPAASLRLLAIRMKSPVWTSWKDGDLGRAPASLVHACELWVAGDLDNAKRELRRARAEGIDTTELREEAELLSAELGVPSQLLPADPPYPNILRYLAIFDLEDRR